MRSYNLATTLHAIHVGGEQAEINVRAASDALEFVDRTNSCLRLLQERTYRIISANSCVILRCAANFAVFKDSCRRHLDQKFLNLHDGRDRFAVNFYIFVYSRKRPLISELK